MALTEWTDVFYLAKISEGDNLSSSSKLSATDLKNRQANLSKTLAFQTPGGGKRKFKEEATSFKPHKRLFTKEDLPENLSPK